LGQLAEEKYTKQDSLLNRFINWLRGVLKKLNLLHTGEFNLLTKLSDVADAITDDLFTADLSGLFRNSQVLTKELRVDTDLTYENIFGRVKDRVSILRATVKNRKQGDTFKEDIETLNPNHTE
jgi:hypothetical protein